MNDACQAVPDALVLVATGCPHCAALLDGVSALVKTGVIGRLEVVNLAVHPDVAGMHGVKTVPWIRLGDFEFDGALTPGELRSWAEKCGSEAGARDYFFEMLKTGRRVRVENVIRKNPIQAVRLVELLADRDASMVVRLGIGAVLETFRGTGLPGAMVPGLGELALFGDKLVRADACHFLSLIGGDAVKPYLRQCLEDDDPQVREIAREELAENEG